MELPAYHPFRSVKAKEDYLALYDRMAARWPVASQTRLVETSHGQTFVRISGSADAPPLVLLPGLGATSLMWAPNVAALSKSYRTYAVDSIYDNGRSIYIRHLDSVDHFMTWLDELLAALAPNQRVNLLGVSYGGWLTGQFALRFPDRLAKAVLIAPAATVRPLRTWFLVRALLSLLPHRWFAKNFMYWIFEDYAHKDEAGRRWVDEEIEATRLALRCFKSRSWGARPTMLTDEELRGLRPSTLFMVGEHEKIYAVPKALRRLRAVAPQIKIEVIPGAGHDVTMLQAELVSRKVVEFLQQP